MLRKLQQQAAALVQQWQPLLDACTEALTTTSSGTSSRRQALLAALTAFGVACAQDGWLPGALQELGSAVWSAFPQKFACNDPACNNLAGLTETSCAKKLCTDCKVSTAAGQVVGVDLEVALWAVSAIVICFCARSFPYIICVHRRWHEQKNGKLPSKAGYNT